MLPSGVDCCACAILKLDVTVSVSDDKECFGENPTPMRTQQQCILIAVPKDELILWWANIASQPLFQLTGSPFEFVFWCTPAQPRGGYGGCFVLSSRGLMYVPDVRR